MNDILQTSRPYRLDRYEAKFVIPVMLIEEIERFIAPYCSLDPYSEAAGDHFYRVNNLYFDNDNYLFLHRRLSSVENRFNMRIRTYSDEQPLPCFFEIQGRIKPFDRPFEALGHRFRFSFRCLLKPL